MLALAIVQCVVKHLVRKPLLVRWSILREGSNEEHSEGVRCVAAPIRAYGKIVAALSISGSVFSIKMERIERELIGMVVKTAQRISAEMS